ncbi:MAG: cupin domain-containing protein [Chloroflexi bacterium]|nr:cupin domain-containing protein [Chloroflexota bacterium]
MEKMAERRREPEPVRYGRNIEETQRRTSGDAQKVATLPRVLKASDTPWEMGIQAFSRHWVSGVPAERLTECPITTMAISEQILDPNMKGGRHRHVREAIFYIIEGEGYEIHDGKRWNWTAGDIMTVPSYCDHQHFNPNPTKRARLWFSIPTPVEFMAIHWVEQIEMRAGYAIPPDAEPIYGPDKKLAGYKAKDGHVFQLGFNKMIQQRINSKLENVVHIEKPKDTYQEYMKLLEDEVKWRQAVPHVVKAAEVPWEDTQMGRIKFLVVPKRNSGLLTYDAFVQELPPGGASGKHRHAPEEAHKILEGKGYDVHDGVKHEWEAEDMVCIPPYATHQHFNSDPHHPAKFVAFQSRWYTFMGHGGIEHLEDAPGYNG